MQDFRPLLARLAAGERFDEPTAELLFETLLNGTVTSAQTASALTALRLRGEGVSEIAAGARVLRRAGQTFDPGCEVMDTCGTGGDGARTYNISTAVAIVAAGAGVKIAKHGGRAVSSRSGSSEVMARLGVKTDGGARLARAQLAASGMCFLDARSFNPLMRRMADVRAELGFRTIFNVLGPLINPAGASRQLLGVYAEDWVEPIATVLGRLGSQRAWVVNGGGMDELSLAGPSRVAEWCEGRVRVFTVTPEEAGLPRAEIGALVGGSDRENAEALRALLRGLGGPYRDVVLLNCAAALVVADKAADLARGVELAAATIDSGAALNVLERLAAVEAPVA